MAFSGGIWTLRSLHLHPPRFYLPDWIIFLRLQLATAYPLKRLQIPSIQAFPSKLLDPSFSSPMSTLQVYRCQGLWRRIRGDNFSFRFIRFGASVLHLACAEAWVLWRRVGGRHCTNLFLFQRIVFQILSSYQLGAMEPRRSKVIVYIFKIVFDGRRYGEKAREGDVDGCIKKDHPDEQGDGGAHLISDRLSSPPPSTFQQGELVKINDHSSAEKFGKNP